MLKFLLTFLILLNLHSVSANMASPVNEGTMSARMITSKDVRILKENIHIKLNKYFREAKYTIEYHIRSTEPGGDIPLLFYAMDLARELEFRVWLDGKPVKLISDTIRTREEDEKRDREFIKTYISDPDHSRGCIHVFWDKYESRCITSGSLKYFEAELTKGDHVIRVEYVGDVWTDRSEWIKTKSFRYSLSPARFWKSFGKLDLTIDARDYKHPLTLRIGNHTKTVHSDQFHQTFNKLPGDYIIVEYQPKVSSTAEFLISVGPFYLALTIIVVMILSHALQMSYRYSIQGNYLRFTVFILLSFIVSLIACSSYFIAEEIIDQSIGGDASRYHGYSFILTFLVVLFWPVYGVIMYQWYKVPKKES